jgi:hypothetical protein
VPIGAAGILLATVYVKDVEGEGTWPLDVTGFRLWARLALVWAWRRRARSYPLGSRDFAGGLRHSPHDRLCLACAPRRFFSPRSQTSVDQNFSRERDGRFPVPDRDWINSFFASADVASRFWDDRISIRLGHFHRLGGAMAMKATAAPILRIFGFRREPDRISSRAPHKPQRSSRQRDNKAPSVTV